MKLKITFKVQSISDIITNSSSEVFLRIDSKDEKTHNEIYKVMQELFPGNDYEMSPECGNMPKMANILYLLKFLMELRTLKHSTKLELERF